MKVSEANLSQAMKFMFDEFIKAKGLDPDGILAYRPVSQKDEEWLRDNATNGIIYLDKHPTCKAAWVLVKFEMTTDKKFGQHAKYGNSVKISNKEQFKKFFGVEPTNEWADDMVIYVRWDKSIETNKYAYRDFDETTPNFYMYTNHLKTNLDRVIKRLYRINDILDTNPNAIRGNQFVIPYNATDIK